MTEVFRVLEPGPFTIVQDLGRVGFQQFGVPVSGALDQFSARVANWLAGNPETAAVLEITFAGLKLEVLSPAVAAVAGADMPVSVNDQAKSGWESFRVEPGDTITLRPARAGLRGYLAVGGGIDVPPVMGSRSTYTGGALGGFQGRALKKGDVLSKADGPHQTAGRSLIRELRPSLGRSLVLRAVPGPQDDFFDQGAEVFFGSEFKVSAKADRMGYRLEGPAVVQRPDKPKTIISEPCLSGGVQIPPDGQPIILLVEQTVGGYTKIATVVSPDLDLVAQARPGDLVRFQKVDLAQAHASHRDYAKKLLKVKDFLAV